MTLLSITAFSAPILTTLANHLWQSTLFAGTAWLLTLTLRKNRPETRYGLWLIASVKFLVPFSLLVGLGSHLGWSKAPVSTPPTLFVAMEEMSQPFTLGNPSHSAAPASLTWLEVGARFLPTLLVGVWFCGGATVLFFWCLRWRRIHFALSRGQTVKSGREFEALRRREGGAGITRQTDLIISSVALEPGILGIFRPVLLLPAGISDRLTDAQLESIITHELCHVRRQDNLASALHMLVEAVFWFHPLVWWIGARLVDERERACDEEVLKLGTDPQVYAESILKICEFYVESPLFCAAGVTGSNLKRRIEAIMIHRNPRHLNLAMRLLLAAIGAGALFVPFGFGLLHAAQGAPESYSSQIGMAPFYNAPPLRVYEAVSIRPNKSIPEAPPSAEFRPDGLTATSVTLQILIQQAYGVRDFQIVGAPAWISTQRYDVEARVPESLADELGRGDVNQLGAEQRPMLLELLADRFKLSVHRETRELPTYALVIARSGSKLHEATPGDTYPDGLKDSSGSGHGDIIRMLRGQIIGQGVSLDDLVQALSSELGRTALNRTGLTGKYDFTLQWSDDRMIPREYIVDSRSPGIVSKTSRLDPLPAAGFSGPPIFKAIRDRLGLELLESKEQTVPVEMLVIDHAEQITGDEPSHSQSSRRPFSSPTFSSPVNAHQVGATSQRTQIANSPQDGVASIKPHTSGNELFKMMFEENGFSAINVTLRNLIRAAYGVEESRVFGAPNWFNSEKYDVETRMDIAVANELREMSVDQLNAERQRMLQALLTDRFKLALHRETKRLGKYVLVAAKDGPKLHEGNPGDTYANGIIDDGRPLGPDTFRLGRFHGGRGELVGQGLSMAKLVRLLSENILNRSIIDNTGLTGNYDFTLQWKIGDESQGPMFQLARDDQQIAGARAREFSGPSLFTAIQEQLGLELEPADGLAEILVIDSAEKPSEN